MADSLKLDLDTDQLGKIKDAVDMHLQALDTILAPYRAKWDRYIKLYKAIVDEDVKSFPWKGASNIFVAEMYNQISTITAFVLGGTIRQNPPYPVKSLYGSDEEEKEAHIWERWIAMYMTDIMRSEPYWRKHLPYTILLGTHPMKLVFDVAGPTGHPTVRQVPIPLHNIYAYPTIQDLSVNPFIADVSWVAPERIVEWHKKGLFGVDTMKALYEGLSIASGRSEQFALYRVPDNSIPGSFVAILDILIHYRDESDVTSMPKVYRVVYERLSGTILWVEDYTDQECRYKFVRWIPDEDQLFGRGVGDIAYTLQEAYNTTINQAIDNATLANTRFFVVPTGSGLVPGESIYPGRVLTSPMADRVKVFAMGDVYQSAFVMPATIRTMIQASTGSGDSFMGQPDQVTKTRHTAQGQAMNLQYTASRLDLNSAEIEEGLVDIVWSALGMLAKYAAGYEFELPPQRKVTQQQVLEALLSGDTAGDGDLSRLMQIALNPEDAAIMEKVFRMPDKVLRRERFKIACARRAANKDTEREAAIVLAQLVEKYLKGVTDIATMMSQVKGQPGMEVLYNTLVEVWKASSRAMQRVLISFSVEDSADLLVELKEVERAIGSVQGALPVPGAEAVPGGAAGGDESGMEESLDRFGTGISGVAGAIQSGGRNEGIPG